MRLRLLPLLSFTAAAVVAGPAHAHDLWLERDGAGFALRYGHRGGELLAIDPARVKGARCVEKGATRDLLAAATFSPQGARMAGRCDVAVAFFDGGTWSLTPDGEVNQPRSQVAQAVKAWESRQFAKWVDARSPAAAGVVLGDELELVAAGDLSKAREGDKIAVRVLSRGQPVPGAVVAIDHKPLGESDSTGEVRVRIRSPRVETIGATLRRRLASPDADQVVLEASLTFEVAK
jgi:uncharacterized GH25 family protein